MGREDEQGFRMGSGLNCTSQVHLHMASQVRELLRKTRPRVCGYAWPDICGSGVGGGRDRDDGGDRRG